MIKKAIYGKALAVLGLVLILSAGRAHGTSVNDPEGVGPVAGGWGALEVFAYGASATVEEAIAKIEDGGGARIAYDLDGPINLRDHEGDFWKFDDAHGFEAV